VVVILVGSIAVSGLVDIDGVWVLSRGISALLVDETNYRSGLRSTIPDPSDESHACSPGV
jgi:hypothetical protein